LDVLGNFYFFSAKHHRVLFIVIHLMLGDLTTQFTGCKKAVAFSVAGGSPPSEALA
jgi:hypothetical protein